MDPVTIGVAITGVKAISGLFGGGGDASTQYGRNGKPNWLGIFPDMNTNQKVKDFVNWVSARVHWNRDIKNVEIYAPEFTNPKGFPDLQSYLADARGETNIVSGVVNQIAQTTKIDKSMLYMFGGGVGLWLLTKMKKRR